GIESTRAPLSLLREPHANHRDLLAWATTKESTDATAPEDQNRHIMRPQHVLETHRYIRCPCWLSADNVTNRVLVSILLLATTRTLSIKAAPSPAARSPLQSGSRDAAPFRTLQLRRITPKPGRAANSP